MATPRGTTVTNGGTQPVRHGRVEITQRCDGFVHPGDPGFQYGCIKRNPRTFAGIDAQGRTVLITVDGRSTEDLDLSVPDERRAAEPTLTGEERAGRSSMRIAQGDYVVTAERAIRRAISRLEDVTPSSLPVRPDRGSIDSWKPLGRDLRCPR